VANADRKRQKAAGKIHPETKCKRLKLELNRRRSRAKLVASFE